MDRMCIWPWKIRVAAVIRQLYEMGIHDVAKRRQLAYDDVKSLDGIIQHQLNRRPDSLKMELEQSNTSDNLKN